MNRIAKQIDDVEEALATKLYYKYIDNDPWMHTNRLPTWAELTPKQQDQWIYVAREAIREAEVSV